MWFEAAEAGDLDTLQICLFWEQRVDAIAPDGRTALAMLAAQGNAVAVALLLEHKADPNLGSVRPLTAAIENEHWDIATALVRAGADPNADGVASIVIADPPKRQLLALMLQRGLDPHGAHPDFGPYIHFALNDATCADMFLGGGFDLLQYERETGESLLERALSLGIGRFLHLLSLGANVNLPVDRHSGRTMLMTVAADEPGLQTESVVRMLLKRGADLDRRDADGLTALELAKARGNTVVVKLITDIQKEQARLAKAQAKATAAAEAKLVRQRNAAARKAAAALRAAEAKRRKASAKRAKRAKRARRPKRGQTADHAPTPKVVPEAPHRSTPAPAA
jgi:ankyrin repeat protein